MNDFSHGKSMHCMDNQEATIARHLVQAPLCLSVGSDGNGNVSEAAPHGSDSFHNEGTFKEYSEIKPPLLLVEDNPIDQKLLSRTITNLGYPEPFLASGCEEAIQIASDRHVELAIMDIDLPGQLDGIDIAGKLHDKFNLPVIFVTAYTSPKLRKRAYTVRPSGYLIKPVNPESLHVNIQIALQNKHLHNNIGLALKEAELLAENNADGILVADEVGNVLFANKAACDIFDRDRHEIYLHNFGIPLSGNNQTVEIEIVSSPEKKIGEMRSSAIEWRGQRAFLITIRDITERIKRENEKAKLIEKLHQAQKIDAVGTLAGGIAHDFNNILSSVLGYAELALDELPEQEVSVRHGLAEITKSALKAKSLVRQILTFSRVTDDQKCCLSINEVASDAAGMLGRTLPKMIRLKLDLQNDLRPVNADPHQMEQVFINLVTNSADAIQESGTISISTRNVDLERQACEICGEEINGHYVLISIKDDGIGMSPEIQAKMFEPFFTTKGVGEGTGLGLSITYGIITAHGGHISCKSQVNQGTEICLYLPVAYSELPKIDSPNETAAMDLGGVGTILIVDDEPAIREMAQKMLTRKGYEVILADSGEKALSIYKERTEEVDLVIMDLGMPGMGGKACLAEMRRFDPNAKVIIASGYIQYELTDELELLGGSGMIAKPYRLNDILQKIQDALDK